MNQNGADSASLFLLLEGLAASLRTARLRTCFPSQTSIQQNSPMCEPTRGLEVHGMDAACNCGMKLRSPLRALATETPAPH